MKAGAEGLPDDVEALKAALIVARAEAAAARAQQSDDQALIVRLKLQIKKLNRDRYGPGSERTARLLDQLELTLEELESAATKMRSRPKWPRPNQHGNIVHAQASIAQTAPRYLPRERVIVPGPVVCACCGGARLSKLGEDITKTLERGPKSWRV